MYSVDHIQIKYGDAVYSYSDDVCRHSKNLYNAALFIIRNNFTAQKKDILTPNEQYVHDEISLLHADVGAVISYNQLERLMRLTNNPDFFAGLPMQTAQQAVRQAAQDFRNWLKSLKEYKKTPSRFKAKPRMPHYKKIPVSGATFTNQDAVVRDVVCYGAPLDTDKAVDSEGILAYIRAVRYLHQMTKEEKYLKHMHAALDYEFSFKFCYNSPIQIPPLSRVGWSSCGGSITSTANPHIHPMSSTIVDEMVYYVRETQDSYVRNRMMDTVLWGCQTFNTYDGEYDYGEKGWMSERFCYSQGLVVQPYEDGSLASTWFALMPWAGGSVVEGLAGEAWDILGRGIKGKNKLNLNRE